MKPLPDMQPPLSSSVLRRRLWLLALAVLAVIALAIGWTATPLREWLDVDVVVSGLQRFGESFGPVAATFGFALAMTLAVPLTFLTLVALVAFGPWAGFACAMVGALLGAAASYGIGAFLGHEVLLRLAGPRINMLSQRMARRGLVAVILVRLVPVAPFAVINMVAGASHIRLRDLVLGTAIGMTPGTLAMMLFVDQITEALRRPTPLTFALLGGTVLLIGAGAWGLQRWLRSVDR
ncbi:MAG: TVP38/TMEM64 family protein [Rhodoferax sp.]|nr:TVP38/TMEM64 family protein [Rhodoferax sp.]MCB2030042.1 TVP38/TMEM64 family protein [Rhodoferax sp.]MCB2041563.1 TVP38/TMEM64 family protein [Rhodoferax sp.]MCP5261401.1 TVP38/TMEM64 family protein [Rhodoferax sp.]MCW5629848.1 TVP38/TMEM64 family protein [Rhodoferax sp.]